MTSGNLTGRALLFAGALGMWGCGGHAQERAPAALLRRLPFEDAERKAILSANAERAFPTWPKVCR